MTPDIIESPIGTPYHCRNCGGFVGYLLEDGRLRLGRWTTPRASFECECGFTIVWSAWEFRRKLKDDQDWERARLTGVWDTK